MSTNGGRCSKKPKSCQHSLWTTPYHGCSRFFIYFTTTGNVMELFSLNYHISIKIFFFLGGEYLGHTQQAISSQTIHWCVVHYYPVYGTVITVLLHFSFLNCSKSLLLLSVFQADQLQNVVIFVISWKKKIKMNLKVSKSWKKIMASWILQKNQQNSLSWAPSVLRIVSFVRFLEESRTPYFFFEIYWPLSVNNIP